MIEMLLMMSLVTYILSGEEQRKKTEPEEADKLEVDTPDADCNEELSGDPDSKSVF